MIPSMRNAEFETDAVRSKLSHNGLCGMGLQPSKTTTLRML